MLPESAIFQSVFRAAFVCLLVWFAGIAQAQASNGSVRLAYLPQGFESSGQPILSEALHLADKALRQRADPSHTATLLQRVRIDLQHAQAIKEANSDLAENLKSKQILWQSDMARQDMNEILRFHAETNSDLASRLQWFWSNHFNVFGMKRNVKLLLADYDANALSPKLTGGFSKLLASAVLHPAMVIYLDNSSNRKSKGNENLAREILELHTLGVDGGYTQADVLSLAKALTGITVAGFKSKLDLGDCNPPRCVVIDPAGTILDLQQHDTSVKTLLGKKYHRSDGLEVLDMLADLAAHPSTAKHLSQKLLQYFIADEPDAASIERLSRVFEKSSGDLTAVYRALFSGPLPTTARQGRFSDPFTYMMRVARIMRMAGADLDYPQLNRVLRDWGQGLYQRITPDGYPLESSYWSGAASLTERLDSVDQMIKLAFAGTDQQKQSDRRLAVLVKQIKPNLLSSTRGILARYENDTSTWLTYVLVSPELVF